MKGRISSFQSMGAVDGPGLRCVVFMQGCPLRCPYCHNPETWDKYGGREIAAEKLTAKIDRYRNYILKDGGVTVSGGEPLMQWRFVAELFRQLKNKGYHTALDTSGVTRQEQAEKVLCYTDLVIADLKFTDKAQFSSYCNGDIQKVYDFLALTAEKNIPLWIRQVIVPGINDTPESVLALKTAVMQYPNLEKIELLPFRKICESKYEAMEFTFPLKDTPECTAEKVKTLQDYIDSI